MSWLFSRALVEAYSEGIFSDGEPSALLSGNPIPQAYCAPDKTKEFSRLSRFGMTYAPLTENRGEELLTWYLAGFPARTSVLRGGGAGITGSRSGLWKEMARIIREVRPQYAFIENSPMLTIRGLDTVLCDLAEMGFNANWGVISAADVGAPHRRERIWIVAHAMRDGLKRDNDRNAGAMGNQKQREESQESETWRSTEVFEISGYLAHSNLQHDQRRGQPCKPISSGGETWTELNGGRSNVAYSDSAQRKGNECAERSIAERADIGESSWWSSEP